MTAFTNMYNLIYQVLYKYTMFTDVLSIIFLLKVDLLKINALSGNTVSVLSFNDWRPMSISMLQKCALKVKMFYIPTSGKINDNIKTLAAIFNHPVFLALVDLFHLSPKME